MAESVKPGYRISDAERRHGHPAFEAQYRRTYAGAEKVALRILGRGWTDRVAIESRYVGGDKPGKWNDRREFVLPCDHYALVHVLPDNEEG